MLIVDRIIAYFYEAKFFGQYQLCPLPSPATLQKKFFSHVFMYAYQYISESTA